MPARTKLHASNIEVPRVLVEGVVINPWVNRHVVRLVVDALVWEPRPTGVTAVV